MTYRLSIAEREQRSAEPFAWAGGVNPGGEALSVSRRGWQRDGSAWFPRSGEYHFARSPRHRWHDELAKMKAAGLDTVATYVLWNHHESAPGEWRWSGDRDLRAFIRECAAVGLRVWLRIGPYCNAEATHGGLPEFALAGARTDDPGYLAHVERYWRRLAEEIAGLGFVDGGPIVAIQVENEYDQGDPAHIATLRELIARCGMDAPFFNVTANTRFDPPTRVLPLLGGYAYRGWERGGGEGPISGFSFGTDEWQATTDLGRIYYPAEDYPRGYIEMGTGSPMRGLDRFRVQAGDVIAQAYDGLGRGASMLGYYMFHGGTQQPGLHGDWSLSYDFQAPVGEFGALRPSWAQYRRLHSFIAGFTAELDATGVVRDGGAIPEPEDTTRLRHIGRFDERGGGFWFVNNRQRNIELPQRDDVQVEIVTASGVLTVPDRPLTLPAGAFAVFPVRLRVGDAEVRWATLQPLARMRIAGVDTIVLWRPTWSTGELATLGELRVEHGQVTMRTDAAGATVAVGEGSWSARLGSGRVVVVGEEDSLGATPLALDGGERVVFSCGGDLVDVDGVAWLVPAGAELAVDVLPGEGLSPGGHWRRGGESRVPGAARWVTTAPDAEVVTPALVPLGGGRWRIEVDTDALTRIAEAQLIVDYAGASAALFVDGTKITEDLFHGDPWTIDLVHAVTAWPGELVLQVEPWDDGIRGVERPDGAMPAVRAVDLEVLVRVGWSDAR
ncbi:beta-galactosidase [Microbacterium sp. PMB16]|uniref:beta-galactosidase n=1 Tax=Microbacterium sp. PMB16 TaxID=3120157 RepID=UPI003F4B2072